MELSRTNWVNSKGQKITNKNSASHFWTISKEAKQQSDFARQLIQDIYQNIPQEQKIIFIAELENISIFGGNTVSLQLQSKNIISVIEENKSILTAVSRNLLNSIGNNAKLEYKVKQQ